MSEVASSALFAEVGECLHAWGNVEIEVSQLFMIVHAAKWDEFTHPLRAAFESVVALEARLDMIMASVQAIAGLENAYPPHFKSLRKKTLALYRKRHEIAHFVLIGRKDGDALQHRIKPFFTWAAFQNDTGRAELDIKQIRERRAAFLALAERFVHHRQHVGASLGLRPDLYAQAGMIAYPSLDLMVEPAEED